MTPAEEKAEHDAAEDAYRRAYLEPGAPPPSMTPAEYRGLYGEVVTSDCYGLKTLSFIPAVIFDLGANVGAFTAFAEREFPEAKIVAVEPDGQNVENMRYLLSARELTCILQYAIGTGDIYSVVESANGAKRSFIGDGSPHLWQFAHDGGCYRKCDVGSMSLLQLVDLFPKHPRFIKIDIEGGEPGIFEDESSMKSLVETEGFAIELHNRAWLKQLVPRLSMTHHVVWDDSTCVLKGLCLESD